MTGEALTGVFVVDKPAGLTSHDVVNKVRRIAQTKKVGHLGTLDPSATGVLPLLVGRATRLARFFERNDKVYEAGIRFGFSTDTYDAEGQPTSEPVDVSLSFEVLEEELSRFLGKIQQVPPRISAKKIGGQPAYKIARQNLLLEMKPVEVEILSIKLMSVQDAMATIRVHCGAGTYIRSIAHDLGQRLGCGAHIAQLRRTMSGSFAESESRSLQDLATLASSGDLGNALIPASELLPEIPSSYVDDINATLIRQGRDFPCSPFQGIRNSRFVKAVTHAGDLVAIGEAKLPNLYHPIVVL